MLQGFGHMEWVDGKEFRGNYEADMKQGYGVYSYADGSKVESSWY